MTKVQTADKQNFSRFCGYHQNWQGSPDPILTQTNPQTSCGNYLRRYWHPVFIAGELDHNPKLIRVLGEELVLFRDGSGQIGLVHKCCPHRRASLEYGHCENRGIRCCYQRLVVRCRRGPYCRFQGNPKILRRQLTLNVIFVSVLTTVKEYNGLLFAYLGPYEEIPEFPV